MMTFSFNDSDNFLYDTHTQLVCIDSKANEIDTIDKYPGQVKVSTCISDAL